MKSTCTIQNKGCIFGLSKKNKMNYTEKQIENAKRNYTNFLQYRSVESFDPQHIGYAAAEQRADFHNNIVSEILAGNKGSIVTGKQIGRAHV